MAFAYLIGPPRLVSRQQAMELHGSVCEALGIEDLTFQYSPIPAGAPVLQAPLDEQSRGFSIVMERKSGRGNFKITLDNQNVHNPVRFLGEYIFPPTREHVSEELDGAAEAIFGKLGADWQRVLAEARIKAQVDAGQNAAGFFTDKVLKLDRSALEASPDFAGISFETPAGHPTPGDSLHQPKREVKLEVLREDPRGIYLEVMSQWPQFSVTLRAGQLPVEVDASAIRTFENQPSKYVQNTMEYITEHVLPLFARTAR